MVLAEERHYAQLGAPGTDPQTHRGSKCDRCGHPGRGHGEEQSNDGVTFRTRHADDPDAEPRLSQRKRYARLMLQGGWQVARAVVGLPPVASFATRRTFLPIAVRTLALDDLVTSAVSSGVRQVVILGAGYDSRAMRLAQPGVVFCEVDDPVTQHHKADLVLDRLHAWPGRWVAADLRTPDWADALIRAGFKGGQPVVFVSEGLSMYLAEEQNAQLLHALRRLAPEAGTIGMHVAIAIDRKTTSLPRTAAVVTGLIAALTARREPVAWMPTLERAKTVVEAAGWRIKEVADLQALGRRHLDGQVPPLLGLRSAVIVTAACRV